MEENNGNALTKVFLCILLISDCTVNEQTFTHHKPVLHIYCINKKLMVLTNAQKQKRYRKNLKVRDLYHAMKSKHAERMRTYRQSFTGQAKQDYYKRHAGSQRTYRSKNIRLSGKFVQLISKRISEIFGFCHCIEGGFLLRYPNFGPISSELQPVDRFSFFYRTRAYM